MVLWGTRTWGVFLLPTTQELVVCGPGSFLVIQPPPIYLLILKCSASLVLSQCQRKEYEGTSGALLKLGHLNFVTSACDCTSRDFWGLSVAESRLGDEGAAPEGVSSFLLEKGKQRASLSPSPVNTAYFYALGCFVSGESTVSLGFRRASGRSLPGILHCISRGFV